MIKFGVDSIAEAMDLGREAAEFVSKQFINPIKLVIVSGSDFCRLFWEAI